MEERKFVCKYCNKKYPCGKSLGGHIRTHLNNEHSSYQSKEVKTNADDSVVKFDGGRKRKRDFWPEEEEEADSENPIYGFRENLKKKMMMKKKMVIIPKASTQKERFCKECGKGFLSLKALCGHMACHSEKDKGIMMMKNKFENNSGMMMMDDSESDAETLSAPNYPRRSRRKRFKTVNTDTNHGSSSLSDLEQEQEEVAKCLMLLSKDSGHRHRGSSDNNSVKSSSVGTRIIFKNGEKHVMSNGAEIKEEKVVMYKNRKFKSSEIVDSDNSDSGYFRNGPKKLTLDVPIEKHLKNREFKTPKFEDRSRSGFEFGLIKNRGRTEIINCKKRSSYNSLFQNKPNGFPREGSWKKQESLNSEKIIMSGSYDHDDSSEYDESDESTTDTDAYPSQKFHSINGRKIIKCKKRLKSKKGKEHTCPICYKIFKSGQALGGHKRSHFVGGSEENNTVVIKQDSPVVQCLIDLNLPAPVDD